MYVYVLKYVYMKYVCDSLQVKFTEQAEKGMLTLLDSYNSIKD